MYWYPYSSNLGLFHAYWYVTLFNKWYCVPSKFVPHQSSLHSKVIFHQRQSSIKGCPPLKDVFYQRSSIFQKRSSSIKFSCLSSKVVCHQRSSHIKGWPPSKVIFHWKLSSMEGCPPCYVVLLKRVSSIESHLPWKVFFHKLKVVLLP